MIYTVSLAVALISAAAMNLLIKSGVRAIQAQQHTQTTTSLLLMAKTVLLNPYIIAGMMCGILNLATYTFALRKFPVSTAYPIMVSMSYAIIVCGATLWFSERLNAWQLVGMVAILTGVWLVATGMAKTA